MPQILPQQIKGIQRMRLQSEAKLSSSVETCLEIEEFYSYASLANAI